MEVAVKEVIQNAIALPPDLRAYLAEVLLESLDFEEDFPISRTWMNEIQRRCSEIDEGKVVLIEGEEALSSVIKRMWLKLSLSCI